MGGSLIPSVCSYGWVVDPISVLSTTEIVLCVELQCLGGTSGSGTDGSMEALCSTPWVEFGERNRLTTWVTEEKAV